MECLPRCRRFSPAVTAAGARRLAVVTAITRTRDMEEETKRWIAAITQRIKDRE